MTQNRKSSRAAYGGPDDEKEVVVTLDRRLLVGVALFVVFGVALGVGLLANRRDGASTAAGGAPPASGQAGAGAPAIPSISDADARAAAAAAGLPTQVTIVDNTIVREPQVTPDPLSGAPGAVQDMATLMPGDSSVPLPIDDISPAARKNAEQWTPDVLAESIPDPNLAEQYRPFKVEDFTEPVAGGPKLAVKDLNKLWSYNFGDVDKDSKVGRDFVVKNVGDADLIISRVYTGCGCTTTKIGDVLIDAAGFLPSPLTLKPWEEVPFTVEFDARLSHESGSLAKFIQIYSNDPTKAVFDDAAPELTHETRFRIVVRPMPAGMLVTPSDDAKRAKDAAGK